jgi:cbb3-type cytochrome oxidase subunit 1
MDRFARNFVIMSIVYLAVASIVGVCMLATDSYMHFKFVHSHLMLIGWVSMMIYGVGYHILPRFSGRPLKHPGLGEPHFWLSNIGLVGMLVFSVLAGSSADPGPYRIIAAASGLLQMAASFLFFYNMLATMLAKTQA